MPSDIHLTDKHMKRIIVLLITICLIVGCASPSRRDIDLQWVNHTETFIGTIEAYTELATTYPRSQIKMELSCDINFNVKGTVIIPGNQKKFVEGKFQKVNGRYQLILKEFSTWTNPNGDVDFHSTGKTYCFEDFMDGQLSGYYYTPSYTYRVDPATGWKGDSRVYTMVNMKVKREKLVF